MQRAGKPGIPDRTETVQMYSRLILCMFCLNCQIDTYFDYLVSCTKYNVFMPFRCKELQLAVAETMKTLRKLSKVTSLSISQYYIAVVYYIVYTI